MLNGHKQTHDNNNNNNWKKKKNDEAGGRRAEKAENERKEQCECKKPETQLKTTACWYFHYDVKCSCAF